MDIKIDGKESEWNGYLKSHNSSTVAKKILSEGIALKLNANGKKDNPDSVVYLSVDSVLYKGYDRPHVE